MMQITVSDSLIVEYDEEQWRLIRVSHLGERNWIVAVEAGGSLRYSSFFATTRVLPDEGEISTDDIDEVILGWSYQTDAWQLSLTISPDLSAARSSSCCEALRFIDPERSVYEQDAKNVGLALARMLGNKPFVMKPPEEAPPPEPIPLADLPLDIGIWRLQTHAKAAVSSDGPDEIRFVRAPSWLWGKMRQIAWYGLLAALYVGVASASINSELALPNTGTLIPDPQLLPYLGLGVAALLLLLIAQQVWQIAREPDTILISSYEGSIAACRGNSVRWKVNAKNVQSVYASELVKKRSRRSLIYHSEINLHLVNGRFQRVIVEDRKLADAYLPGADLLSERGRAVGVAVLEPPAAATALQAAAVHIAACLEGLPVWHDRRYK